MLALSLLIIGLDNTVLNVALPTLQTRVLGVGLDAAVDRRLLPAVVRRRPAHHGHARRPVRSQAGAAVGARASSACASVLAAFAQNADQLIVLRAVMGIGGAMIMPATLSVIMDVFPREERGKAIGIWSAIAAIGIGLGPFVGGLLLEWFSWSSVFWLNVPIARSPWCRRFARPREPRPAARRVRPRRRRPLDRGARRPGLRDDRGRPARLDRAARPRLLRARARCSARVRRVGAPRRRADAAARLLPQPALQRGVRQRRRSSSSR